MEGMTRELDRGELLIRNLHALWVFVFIQFGTYRESGCGAGRRDQLDNRLEAAQGLSAPIDGDEGKQTMFDLIPFAGPGRQVAYGDRGATHQPTLAVLSSTDAHGDRCCRRH